MSVLTTSRYPIVHLHNSLAPYKLRSDSREHDLYRPQRPSPTSRDAPEPSKVLGVFGLSLRTREYQLEDIFGKYGAIEKVTIIYDQHSRKSRGFGFVTFKELDGATQARNELNGLEIDERKIRVASQTNAGALHGGGSSTPSRSGLLFPAAAPSTPEEPFPIVLPVQESIKE
ncbi:hypothetical protein HK102_001143 [Quaeritorhiza haematococci]|nr:hypothetical protein HK102_001143 [Quaeritorhiza haematococci]